MTQHFVPVTNTELGDRCLSFSVFFLVPVIPLFFGLLISSLRVLMVRFRVQSMQADMPVGSDGSTCSPFPTCHTHSFHTVAMALHYKDTLKQTQTAAMHFKSPGSLLI